MRTPLDDLARRLGPAALVTDPEGMAPYLTDWRGRYRGTAACVVRPANVADVQATVAWARAHGIAVVPQGGNTGMAGAATPSGKTPQIVLTLDRMAAIRKLDRVAMTLEVEAGCILEHARQAAARVGRLLPITFGAQGSATVGGMVSTNAGGINALRYGTARHLVLGLEAVLADGSLVDGLRGLRKDNAGWDWKQLLIGSEGTLGIVTAVVLRLVPLPRERAVAFVSVASPERALELLERMQDTMGDALTAFELISGTAMDIALRHLGGRAPIESAGWLVLMEVADSAGQLRERLEGELLAAAEADMVVDATLAGSAAQESRFWALREGIPEGERAEGPAVKHDVSVPVSETPSFLHAVETALAGIGPGLRMIAFGHLGDGNIHLNVAGRAEGTDDAAVNRVVHDLVMRYRGSITAEHGIGQYRVAELMRLKSPPELALLVRLKRALDPEGLLNPGKVLPEEPPSAD